jgi:hypothetical protein
VVLNFNKDDQVVEVRGEIGTASSILPLRGVSSGASVFYSTIAATEKTYIESGTDDTDEIELERAALDIIDFTDKDPFSEGNY